MRMMTMVILLMMRTMMTNVAMMTMMVVGVCVCVLHAGLKTFTPVLLSRWW